MKKKESSFHVESAHMAPALKGKLPSKAEYAVQAIVYSIIGVILCAGSFMTLPQAFAIALPVFARLAAAVGFFACASSCFMGAKGFALQHPLYFVLTAVQVLSSAILFIWFVFGDNQLAVPWKVLAGVMFGGTALVLTLPLVVKIAFPGLMEQALNAAELESKNNRKIGNRDR